MFGREKMTAIYKMDITVGPESIDMLKHVNNREYLRWMEEAAIAHGTSRGWTMMDYFKRGEVWVVREHWIEYLRPTFLGDQLTMYTWVQNVEGSRSLRRYALVKDGRIVSCGATEWAFIDLMTGRAKEVPQEIAESFELVSPNDEFASVRSRSSDAFRSYVYLIRKLKINGYNAPVDGL